MGSGESRQVDDDDEEEEESRPLLSPEVKKAEQDVEKGPCKHVDKAEATERRKKLRKARDDDEERIQLEKLEKLRRFEGNKVQLMELTDGIYHVPVTDVLVKMGLIVSVTLLSTMLCFAGRALLLHCREHWGRGLNLHSQAVDLRYTGMLPLAFTPLVAWAMYTLLPCTCSAKPLRWPLRCFASCFPALTFLSTLWWWTLVVQAYAHCTRSCDVPRHGSVHNACSMLNITSLKLKFAGGRLAYWSPLLASLSDTNAEGFTTVQPQFMARIDCDAIFDLYLSNATSLYSEEAFHHGFPVLGFESMLRSHYSLSLVEIYWAVPMGIVLAGWVSTFLVISEKLLELKDHRNVFLQVNIFSKCVRVFRFYESFKFLYAMYRYQTDWYVEHEDDDKPPSPAAASELRKYSSVMKDEVSKYSSVRRGEEVNRSFFRKAYRPYWVLSCMFKIRAECLRVLHRHSRCEECREDKLELAIKDGNKLLKFENNVLKYTPVREVLQRRSPCEHCHKDKLEQAEDADLHDVPDLKDIVKMVLDEDRKTAESRASANQTNYKCCINSFGRNFRFVYKYWFATAVLIILSITHIAIPALCRLWYTPAKDFFSIVFVDEVFVGTVCANAGVSFFTTGLVWYSIVRAHFYYKDTYALLMCFDCMWRFPDEPHSGRAQSTTNVSFSEQVQVLCKMRDEYNNRKKTRITFSDERGAMSEVCDWKGPYRKDFATLSWNDLVKELRGMHEWFYMRKFLQMDAVDDRISLELWTGLIGIMFVPSIITMLGNAVVLRGDLWTLHNHIVSVQSLFDLVVFVCLVFMTSLLTLQFNGSFEYHIEEVDILKDHLRLVYSRHVLAEGRRRPGERPSCPEHDVTKGHASCQCSMGSLKEPRSCPELHPEQDVPEAALDSEQHGCRNKCPRCKETFEDLLTLLDAIREGIRAYNKPATLFGIVLDSGRVKTMLFLACSIVTTQLMPVLPSIASFSQVLVGFKS